MSILMLLGMVTLAMVVGGCFVVGVGVDVDVPVFVCCNGTEADWC